MAEDLYALLGVPRNASAEEIRRAYRRLAKRYHPDFNPGNREAEERFKKISQAYEILGDPEKRAKYDRGEIDASGQERPQYRTYRDFAEAGGHRYEPGFDAGFDFEDLVSEILGGFRRGGPRRGADVRVDLELGFLEAAKGSRRRIRTPDGRTVEVTIPPGVDDGTVLRLPGQGLAGARGGPPGDLLVAIAVRPHPHFRREGRDIHLRLPVALDEAVLGAKVEVPTIDGPVRLTIPKGTSSGARLRLKGKGILDPATGRRGDQYVEVLIVLPERIDPELEAWVRKWRAGHSYDPRARLREQAA